jgi:peptidoglycan hydrolase-like protein with peptidoglycan-binding domain
MRHVPRRIGAGLAVVIAIAAVIAIVLIVDSPSSSPGATNGSQSAGATTVQRRNLVSTDTESGTLSYANSQTVYNRLSGTITWLPSVGQVIKPGGTLYKVSGDPVILMNGSTPAYRDLSAADSAGPDILELNRNLVRLGFDPDGIVADDVWQPATTAAVEMFQESLGQEPTGVLTLGQVVFLPGDQLVSALETSVGSTGGSSGSPSSSSAADLSPARASTEFVSLTGPTTAPKPHRKPKRTQTLAALLALLKAETEQLKAEQAQLSAEQAANHSANNSPSGAGKSSGGGKGSGNAKGSNSSGSSNSSNSSSSGGSSPSDGSSGGGGSASPILQTSSTQLVATVDLDASKQSEAKVGEKVTVEMPAGNTTGGTVTAVSSVAQSSSNNGSGNGNGNGNGNSGGGNGGNGSSTATIPVTISLRGHISGAGLDQAAVSVEFAQAKASNVLSVPVTALLATSGGNYAVQAAAAPHRLIPVTTGLFAAGYVQISGPGIYSGLQVTDSQG